MGKESDPGTTTQVLDIQIRTGGGEYVSFGEKAVKDCDEYYPDCDKKTYRVPPTIVTSKSIENKGKTKNAKPDEDYSILKEQNAANVKGKDAESLILDAFEDLKNIHDEEQPMFIISNYVFENYLNEVKTELCSITDIFPKEAGEHDLLLLHLQHGVVFIQVKAVEEFKPESTEEVRCKKQIKKQRDNHNKKIKDRVDDGLRQLDRDVKIFNDIMKDLKLKIPIIKVLALPSISKKYMSTLEVSMRLLQDKLGKNALDLCIFSDQININKINQNEGKKRLLEWWEHNMSQKPGFRDADEYKQVIGRYVGLMSTVEIRTFGDVIAEEGFQNMRIVLTPEQVEILRLNDRKVYIQGSFGTGKSIILILKARQMVREGEPVLMVCGRSTKHLSHLVACVKADMTEEQKHLVHYIQDYKTLHKLDSIDQYNIFVDECYIFALSYIVHYCGKNNKLCWLAGRCVPDVSEFSVKHLTKELRSPETVKSVCDKLDEDFLYDVVESGDFPVIDHSFHKKYEDKMPDANGSMFNGSTIWRCEQCWENIRNVFVQMKLIKENHETLDSQADPCRRSEEASTEATCAQIPDNTLTNELKDRIEPHGPLAWSDIAILVPHSSFITKMDIKAIDQVSDKYGIPFNYCLLRDNQAVENKDETQECGESGDGDMLLGNRNEVIISASSQFLGLERKVIIVAGWETITTDVEMSDCQAWISLLDLSNILTIYNSPKRMTVNTLDDFSNQAKFHLVSEMLNNRPIFSQGMLLLADTYLADCDNKCHFNDIAQAFCLKLIKITNCMDNFETSLAKFKKDLDKFFTDMEHAFKSRFSRYSDQFDEDASWNAFLQLISVLTKQAVVVNDKGTIQTTERDSNTLKTTERYEETSQSIRRDVETLQRSKENTTTPEKTEQGVNLLQTISGNVKISQVAEGDINTSQTTERDVKTTQTHDADAVTLQTTKVNVTISQSTERDVETKLATDGDAVTLQTTERDVNVAQATRRDVEPSQRTEGNIKMKEATVDVTTPPTTADAKPSETAGVKYKHSLVTEEGSTTTLHLTNESDLLNEVETFVLEIFVPQIKSLLNVDDSDESSGSEESITPSAKSNPLALMITDVSQSFLSNSLTRISGDSPSTTDSKPTTEGLDADPPPASDTQPLDCLELAAGLLPGIQAVLQNYSLSEEGRKQGIPQVISTLSDIVSSEEMKKVCKLYEEIQSQDLFGLPGTPTANKELVTTDTTAVEFPDSVIKQVEENLPTMISLLPTSNTVHEQLWLSEGNEINESPDFTKQHAALSLTLNESEDMAGSTESSEPSDLTKKYGSSSLTTDSKQTDNCLGIESLSTKLKNMSEQFFPALRLALQTHISISCNLCLKDASGKELVNDFEQSERSNEAKQSNESSCSNESTGSNKTTLPNESSQLDESTLSNESTSSNEITPLDKSIPSNESTKSIESTRSDESIHSKEEISSDKPVNLGSNGDTQTNEIYLSIDFTLLDFPVPSTTNDTIQLFFSALESQDETKLGFPMSIIKDMLKQSTRSKETTQSDASTQSGESTRLDELSQSKESTHSNESTQVSSKRDSQTSTIHEITPDPTVETNVPSNFKLKIKENGLIIDLPWQDMPTNFQNEGTKTLFKYFGSFDMKLNVKDLQKFALSRQSNEMTGEAMKSFLKSYTRLRDSFASTGLLKNISTWFVKMVFLYSAISRSTSRVFIWRKK